MEWEVEGVCVGVFWSASLKRTNRPDPSTQGAPPFRFLRGPQKGGALLLVALALAWSSGSNMALGYRKVIGLARRPGGPHQGTGYQGQGQGNKPK